MLNFLQNGRCFFLFTILFVLTTTLTISNENPFIYFSQFSTPYSTLTWSQNHPYNSFPLYLSNFSPSNTLHQKLFSLPRLFSHFQAASKTREIDSLVRIDTVLISPFFFKVQIVITGRTVIDSLSFRLRKLVFWDSNLWWRCLQSEWQSIQSIFSYTLNLLLLLPYYTNTITRTQIPLE